MPLKIVRNDITKVKADIIVNTANPEVGYSSGTDKAIYEAAGVSQMLEARNKIGKIAPGDIAVTSAFGLNAQYVIHAVNAYWDGGNNGEYDILRKCYEKSLQKAIELKCSSIAFPLMAAGNYGFPKEKALEIAISSISTFLMENELKVLLVVFDRKAFELSGKLFLDVDAFIDENYVSKKREDEYLYKYDSYIERDRRYFVEDEKCYSREELKCDDTKSSLAPCCDERVIGGVPDKLSDNVVDNSETDEVLSDLLHGLNPFENSWLVYDELTFRDKLFELIDKRGMNDVEVYKKANIDRKVFSSIKCKKDYNPKKKTAVSFAIALELNLEETVDLLQRAGIALTRCNKFDLAIMWFINEKKYNIFEINEYLFKKNLPTLD